MKNKIIPYLKEAKVTEAFKLLLTFEDGVIGEIDLSEFKGKGVFRIWNDESFFSNVKINQLGKLEWSEDIDMDPDAFYLKIIGKTFEAYASNL